MELVELVSYTDLSGYNRKVEKVHQQRVFAVDQYGNLVFGTYPDFQWIKNLLCHTRFQVRKISDFRRGT